MITLLENNETYLRIDASKSILMELSEHFTFDVPGARFMPSFKMGAWDGKIRLLNLNTGLIYKGLFEEICKFADDRGYDIEFPESFGKREFALVEAADFIKSLKLPDHLEMRDYQIKAFVKAIRDKRAMLLSPTSSGKSFIIYLTVRYNACKTLIIVPRLGLVKQLTKDFESYGYDKQIHQIYSGEDKNTAADITITTWQSIYKMPKEWFNQFGLLITDEAHEAEAKSMQGILSKMENCEYRLGFTGTLKESKTHELVLTGLFGPVSEITTTKELQNQGHIAESEIKCIVFNYSKEIRQLAKKEWDYAKEIEYIVTNKRRNEFIAKLVCSLKGSSLVLFQFVEKHGIPLFEMIKERSTSPVYFVSGDVSVEEREAIRIAASGPEKVIIVASYQTFSTGINIPSLENLIFASPTKSKVRVLQSIGRVLRKSDGKDGATVFDLADDIGWKSRVNFTFAHFKERMKYYIQQQQPFKIYRVTLKEDIE